jgi:hypothetical protein
VKLSMHIKVSEVTINVPVVFMARYVMVLRGATSLRGALEGVGPENRDFFGPGNGSSEASAIWAQKSRDTGTLIVIILLYYWIKFPRSDLKSMN